MSKEDRLVEKLPLWKKSTEPVVDAKDYTMITTDRTILFQLLFGLYVANSTYGINPTNIDEFKVEKLPSETEMIFALEAGGDYDVFKLKTKHRVVLQYKTFAVDTNLKTEDIADIFKILLESDFAGKLLFNDLNDPKQDYGTGIEWGVNLALFHPYFKKFYFGETTTKPQNALVFEPDGHQPKWSNIPDKDARKAAQEKIYAEGKTYTLDQFKDVVKGLLDLYDETLDPKNTKYTNSDQQQAATYTPTILNKLYSNFKAIYTEKTVDGIGNLYTFTESDDTLVDELVAKPWNGAIGIGLARTSYTEVGVRTRGYISIFLSIIGAISNEYARDMTTVSKALKSSASFIQDDLPLIEVMYNNFNNHFRGAETALKALQTDYDALKSKYEIYDSRIKFRRDKHIFIKKKFDDATNLIQALNSTNYSETAGDDAKKALEDAKKEESKWKDEAEASEAELTVYNGLKKKLDDLSTEYNKALVAYQTYGAYSGTALPFIDLDILKTTNDFKNTVIAIESQIELAKNTELKQLLEVLKKQENQTEFEKKRDAIKAVYDKIEKLKNNALGEKTNYGQIWIAINAPQVGLNDLTKSIESIKANAQTIATQTGLDMTEIENYFAQINVWRAEILKHASVVQRRVDGDALQKAYDALGKPHPDIQIAIDNFKNNESADQKTLTDTRSVIEKTINDRKTKDKEAEEQAERDEINAEAQKIVVPVVSFARSSKTATVNLVKVLRSNKTEAKVLLQGTSTEFQSLIDETDDISKSRVAAGAMALGLPDNDPNKRKMLAYAQMF